MTKSRTRVRRSLEEWREIVDELHCSDLDRRTFCRQKGLVRETLRQAELRLDRQAPARPFVELTAAPALDAAVPGGWDVELELGDGLVLRLARR